MSEANGTVGKLLTGTAGEFGGGLVTPVASRVLIREPKKNVQTSTGLFIPDTVNDPENSPTGEVIGVGPDVKQLKVGDLVFLRGDSMIYGQIGFAGQNAVLIDESVVLGVWNRKESDSTDPPLGGEKTV